MNIVSPWVICCLFCLPMPSSFWLSRRSKENGFKLGKIAPGLWVSPSAPRASSQTELDAAVASIAANAGDISSNTASITTNTADIATNSVNISSIVTDIGTNATAIAANGSAITTNQAAHVANAAAHVANATVTATNASAITALQADVGDVATYDPVASINSILTF